MYTPLYDLTTLKKRGLITNGFCLPYNPELTARANELRKNMTPLESKLRTGFLKNFSLNVMAQKVIDYYIVDFYCPKLHLVVEIDGNIHDTSEAQDYDRGRTEILKNYDLKIIRFRNEEVESEFYEVCKMIMDELPKS